MTTTPSAKHPVEAKDSYTNYLKRANGEEPPENARRALRNKHYSNTNDMQRANGEEPPENAQRALKNKDHYNINDIELLQLKSKEELQRQEDLKRQASIKKYRKKHDKKTAELLEYSGIGKDTQHGMMIDAGSGGSRMHVFEWEPRVLHNPHEVAECVAGKKLTYPGGDSRWTDRLSPGLSTFATKSDDELLGAVAEYLAPLMDFAKIMLGTKEDEFANFPIYLRATAGMRVLKHDDRFRVMAAVRTLFSNKTFCPFQFEDEHARVISGEEEAVFGWTGINFAMGTLVKASEGAGAVLNPRLTYGALDMGGASTQISFYDPGYDVMSNLFKLQIGQGKHWNLYAHSFLWYGINEAKNRLEARLINDMNVTTRLAEGVYNPCLPGGSDKLVRTDIFIDANGYETWNYTGTDIGKDGVREAILRNPHKKGDPDKCMELAYEMLHKAQNEWCDFSHRGDCSFAGVYQPALPKQSKHFGEFLAFSNYFHVWEFLDLPMRSSLADLENRTHYACSLSKEELLKFNNGRVDENVVEDFCFHSSFVFQVLHNGYGFKMDDYITATNVVNGQKVGWALGSMMYEINTQPWVIENKQVLHGNRKTLSGMANFFLLATVGAVFASVVFIFYRRRKIGTRSEYTPINH